MSFMNYPQTFTIHHSCLMSVSEWELMPDMIKFSLLCDQNLFLFFYLELIWFWQLLYKHISFSGALQKRYKGYTFPLALAIVLSGQYEDDVDNSEEVVYTGQGGNDLLGNKRQVKDQEMIRGNLALKVCALYDLVCVKVCTHTADIHIDTISQPPLYLYTYIDHLEG